MPPLETHFNDVDRDFELTTKGFKALIENVKRHQQNGSMGHLVEDSEDGQQHCDLEAYDREPLGKNIKLQTYVLNRERYITEKMGRKKITELEKRDANIQTELKELNAQSERTTREQQEFIDEIKAVEERLKMIEKQKADATKEVEEINDVVLTTAKADFQSVNKRYQDLENEVKVVGSSVRREKQSLVDHASAAKKEENAMKNEILKLQAVIKDRKLQLESCQNKIESDNVKHETERQQLLSAVKKVEMLLLISMYDKEKIKFAQNHIKADENIACYRKAIEHEVDETRREMLQKNLSSWILFKSQTAVSKQTLDTVFFNKQEKLENGANFHDIAQFEVPNFYTSAIPVNDLVLPQQRTIQQPSIPVVIKNTCDVNPSPPTNQQRTNENSAAFLPKAVVENSDSKVPKNLTLLDIPLVNTDNPDGSPGRCYPIGVIPPYYVCNQGVWTPPAIRQDDGVFDFSPRLTTAAAHNSCSTASIATSTEE